MGRGSYCTCVDIEKVVDQLSEEEYDSLNPDEFQRIENWKGKHGLQCESEDSPIDWI